MSLEELSSVSLLMMAQMQLCNPCSPAHDFLWNMRFLFAVGASQPLAAAGVKWRSAGSATCRSQLAKATGEEPALKRAGSALLLAGLLAGLSLPSKVGFCPGGLGSGWGITCLSLFGSARRHGGGGGGDQWVISALQIRIPNSEFYVFPLFLKGLYGEDVAMRNSRFLLQQRELGKGSNCFSSSWLWERSISMSALSHCIWANGIASVNVLHCYQEHTKLGVRSYITVFLATCSRC